MTLDTVLLIPEEVSEGLPLALTEKELVLASTMQYGFTNIVTQAINIQVSVTAKTSTVKPSTRRGEELGNPT